MMSQPNPRNTGADGGCSGCVIFVTASDERMLPPPLSNASANFARSSPVENRPACPATPPIRLAVGSCTTPRSMCCESSYCVGAMRGLHVAGGRTSCATFSGARKLLRRVGVERLAGDLFYQSAQRDEVDITVRKARSRRLRRWFRESQLVGCLLAVPRSGEIEIRRQSRIMSHQLANRDVILAVLRKLRQIFRHRIVHANLAMLHQLHDRSRASQ